MVALAVVAFREGGVAAVGAVTAARMATAALLAPFLATMADRVRRERVLACVGLVRAADAGMCRGGDGRRRPAGGDVRLRGRRHGRRGAVPAGALGPAARAGQVAAGPDERERGARHAGLARHPRRPGGRRPCCWRRAVRPRSSPRAPRRRCWAGWSSSRCRTTRRRGRTPRAGPAATCSQGFTTIAARSHAVADHGARGRADVHARLPDRVRRRRRDRPARHRRRGRRGPERGRRRRRRARLALRVRAGPARRARHAGSASGSRCSARRWR